jgi:hypothetical protein
MLICTKLKLTLCLRRFGGTLLPDLLQCHAPPRPCYFRRTSDIGSNSFVAKPIGNTKNYYK